MNMSKPAFVAMLVALSPTPNKPDWLQLSDITDIFRRLQELGVDLGYVLIHQSAHGYYSNTAEEIVGNWLRFGWASYENSYKLTECGRKALDSMIKRGEAEDPEESRRIKDGVAKIMKQIAVAAWNSSSSSTLWR